MKDRYTITQDILKKVGQIDQFKGEWERYELLYPQELARLKKVTTIESTGSSTRIEGSQMSDQDIEKFLQGLQISKFRERDMQEVKGYKELLETVFANYTDIDFSENVIKGFHKILLKFSDKDQRHLGDYKKHSNRVAAYDSKGKVVGVIFETTPPYLTSKEMQELVEKTTVWFNGEDKHGLLIIAEFVVDFLSIHPFQDGNGRLSRILTNFLLLKHGYEFVQYTSLEKIIEDNKKLYYLALRRSQKNRGKKNEDIGEWINFFLDVLILLIKKNQRKMKNKVGRLTSDEKQEMILDYLKKNKKITNPEARKLLYMSERGVRHLLNRMIKLEQIKAGGASKQGRFYVLR